ncbi:MAG: hypothetical protein ACPGJV_07660 [Bacteriovoracaceae bacterium]
MKKIIKTCGLIVLFFQTTYAFSSSNVHLYNPLFITPVGKTLGSLSFEYDKGSKELFSSNGTRTRDIETTSMIATTELLFGFMSGVDLGLRAKYWIKDETDSEVISTGANNVVNEKGFEDIFVIANYMIADNMANLGLRMDVHMEFSPGLQTSEVGKTTTDGTKARGGHFANFEVNLGKNNAKHLGYKFTGGIEWTGEIERESPTSSVIEEKYDSTLDFYGGAQFKYLASDVFALGFEGEFKKLATRSQTDATGFVLEYDTRNQITAGIDMDFLSPGAQTPMEFILEFDYIYLSDQDIKTTAGTRTSSYGSENSIKVGLTGKMIF